MKNNKVTIVQLLTRAPFIFEEMTAIAKTFTGKKAIEKSKKRYESQMGDVSSTQIFLEIPRVSATAGKEDKPSKRSVKRKRGSPSKTNSSENESSDNESLSDSESETPTISQKETKRPKLSKNITSIINLIKFAQNLTRNDVNGKRKLDELVEKASDTSLRSLTKNSTDDKMNCETVLDLYEKAEQSSLPLEQSDDDDDVDGSTKSDIVSYLKGFGLRHPRSKIKVVDKLTINTIALNTNYTNVLPSSETFTQHMDDFIAFGVQDITTLKECVYRPTLTKKKRAAAKGQHDTWMNDLGSKLKEWGKLNGWVCNLDMLHQLTKNVQCVVLYKMDTYNKLFPPKFNWEGNKNGSSSESD